MRSRGRGGRRNQVFANADFLVQSGHKMEQTVSSVELAAR